MALLDPAEWATGLGITEAAASLIIGALLVGMIALIFAGIKAKLAGPGAVLGIGVAAGIGVWPIWGAVVAGIAGMALIVFVGVRNFG